MALDSRGKLLQTGLTTVAMTSGSGTQTVSFPQSFVDTPAILVVNHAADAGTYSATSTSKSAFTLSVTGSDYGTRDILVAWVAAEKD